jgi:hypothetical protein
LLHHLRYRFDSLFSEGYYFPHSGRRSLTVYDRRRFMRRPAWLLVLCVLFTAACGGGNPYLEASLKPAELQGKDKAWFEKNWGTPDGKASRFFGGETWTYYRIAGGKSSLPLFNFSPNQCQITLKFDKEEKLSDYSYSGC